MQLRSRKQNLVRLFEQMQQYQFDTQLAADVDQPLESHVRALTDDDVDRFISLSLFLSLCYSCVCPYCTGALLCCDLSLLYCTVLYCVLYCVLCTVLRSVLCTVLCTVQCTVYCAVYCTVYCVLYSVQCTVRCTVPVSYTHLTLPTKRIV